MRNKGYQVDENGDYLITECQKENFSHYFNTTQMQQGFNALWNNVDNMTDKFISFWDAVIFYFWDNPFVVGIDPLNEPWPGNLVLYPDLQTPGYADANSLQPVYAKIFARLMQHYSTHDGRLLNAQMWFEPVTNPNVNGWEGKIYNVGFTEPPGYA